jgi:hypothetical protein
LSKLWYKYNADQRRIWVKPITSVESYWRDAFGFENPNFQILTSADIGKRDAIEADKILF